MRLLLLNQFYPPDTAPTGKYLHDLAQILVRRGHEVEVFCSRRSYNGEERFARLETLDGVKIRRLFATGYGRRSFVGKLADYATFYVSLFFALMLQWKRPDLILSLTTPPYIGVLGKLAAWRHRSKHAHWVMDLYPDVMFAHGMTRKGNALHRMLAGMTRFELRGARTVLALGPAMAKRVATYAPSALWMPLWSDPSLAALPSEGNPMRGERGWGPQETVFLYSGNMGLGHRFGEFLEAARRLGSGGPRWVFSGGGKRRCEIEAFVKANPGGRVELLDYVPREKLSQHLCSADVHLASLDCAWEGLIVPSKLQGSFAVARPVLYVGGHDCETASWIRESGGGWVVEENDIGGLLDAIQSAMDPSERRKRGEAALQFARERFEMSTTCASIANLFEDIRYAEGRRSRSHAAKGLAVVTK